MDNMFQVKQNMTAEQIQKFSEQRKQLSLDLRDKEQLERMNMEQLQKRYMPEQEIVQPVQDMPLQMANEKDYQRVRRRRESLQNQVTELKRSEREQERQAEIIKFFSSTLQPEMFTPKYVLENFKEVKETLDFWKYHLDGIERTGAERLRLKREDILRLPRMKVMYAQGVEAFTSALGALGYEYHPEKKAGSELSEVWGKEKRQSLLEKNREQRAVMADAAARINVEVADELLAEVKETVQEKVNTLQTSFKEDPQYSFIHTDTMSQSYEYEEVEKAKRLIEAHPQEAEQNREQVELLYNELFHLMEVQGFHYHKAQEIGEVQNTRVWKDTPTAVGRTLQERLDKQLERMDTIRTRAESIKAGLKFLLTGAPLTETNWYVLRDFIPIQDAHQQEIAPVEMAAKEFANQYREKQADETILQARQLKQQWQEEKTPERERELGTRVKPMVAAYLEQLKNFDTRFLENGTPEQLAVRNEELQRLAVASSPMTEFGKIKDPESADGRSILDALAGEDKGLLIFKSNMVNIYASRARAYLMVKAYQKGHLGEDAFLPSELESLRARLGLEENSPLTQGHLLFAARELMELIEVSQNTVPTAFFKSEKMTDAAAGHFDLQNKTPHPEYQKKLYRVLDVCAELFQVSRTSVTDEHLQQLYKQSEEKIQELTQELEQIEEPGMLSLEIQEEIKQYREYRDYAQVYKALKSNTYKRAGETETPMGEPMFRSYNSVESLPAFRNMSEEDFALMCKKMSAGALAPDNADPVRQEVYYAENMEGLRMYKERMREHYEMLEREFHHQVPSIDYIMEHELQMQRWFANAQMDNHIVAGMRDLIDLTNPEDLRLYHLVNYYNAMAGYITGIHTSTSLAAADYKEAETGLYIVMQEQDFSKEYLERGEEYHPPVEAERFRHLAEESSHLFGADDITIARYLQRLTELTDYVNQHKDDTSLNMKQYRGWLALIQRRLEPVAKEFYRSKQQQDNNEEILGTAHILKWEFESGDARRMLNAAIEMGKMTLTFNMPNLTQEQSYQERTKKSWRNYEDVEYYDGVTALENMPQEFIVSFIERFYQKKEEMVNRMEQEVARVMGELPAEMEEQDRKLFATHLVEQTEFGREYDAVKIVSDTYFRNETVLDVAKAYLDEHEELLTRTGAMDKQVNDAYIKYNDVFTAIGFTTTVGKEYLKEFQSKFLDKESEAKKANPYADEESYDIRLEQRRVQGQELGDDFLTLTQKLGALQVTEEMLQPEYMVAHMVEILYSFKEMDTYQNLLNANPQLEERIPAAVKLAWTKNRGMYEKYREYVKNFARSKAVNVETGEYILAETYEAEQEEIAEKLSRQKENIQDLLGGFGGYDQKVEDLVSMVKKLKKLKKQDKTNALKPLQEAGDWLKDLTRYLSQPLDISNEDFFDATIMTLMSMFGYIEKDLRETIVVLVNSPAEGNISEILGQIREISLKFTEFKEHVPGQAQELRSQILNSGEDIPLTLRDIVLSAQVLRTFHIQGEQENVGEGASDVIRVTEGNKIYYFKENEVIKNFRESLWEVLPLMGDEIIQQAISEFIVRTRVQKPVIQQQLEDFGSMVNFMQEDGRINEFMLGEFQALLPRTNIKKFATEHPEQWKAFAKAVSKNYVTFGAASSKDLLLAEDANMTVRNYASERVAELLGLKGIVVRNQIAIVKEENGMERKGFIMEQAHGIPAEDVKKKADKLGYEIRITGDAQKQLLNLQILDNIIGQTDRHDGNYFVDYDLDDESKTLTVKKVTGIDNDFAFGKSLVIGGSNTGSILNSAGKYQYTMMDPEMYESIMTLSPELLETNLENVIERQYIDALKTRFEMVREALRKAKDEAEQNGTDFFRKQGGWGEESQKLWLQQPGKSYAKRVMTGGKC